MLRRLFRPVKIVIISIWNMCLFVTMAIWNGTQFHLWPMAWRELKELHLGQIRKTVWELKKAGKVREDRHGFLKWRRDRDE